MKGKGHVFEYQGDFLIRWLVSHLACNSVLEPDTSPPRLYAHPWQRQKGDSTGRALGRGGQKSFKGCCDLAGMLCSLLLTSHELLRP